MRYLRYCIFMSALMIATSVFLPYVQLSFGGISIGKSTSMPLYGAVSNYGFVERIVTETDTSVPERIADALLAKAGSRSNPVTDGLRDFRSTLQDVKEAKEKAQLDTIGTVLRGVGIGFLLALAVIAYLVLQTLSQTSPRPARSFWTAVLMGLVAIIGIALFVAVREALVLGNEELGAAALSLASGAYLMTAACLTGAVAAIAAFIVERRSLRAPPAQDENRSSLASD